MVSSGFLVTRNGFHAIICMDQKWCHMDFWQWSPGMMVSMTIPMARTGVTWIYVHRKWLPWHFCCWLEIIMSSRFLGTRNCLHHGISGGQKMVSSSGFLVNTKGCFHGSYGGHKWWWCQLDVWTGQQSIMGLLVARDGLTWTSRLLLIRTGFPIITLLWWGHDHFICFKDLLEGSNYYVPFDMMMINICFWMLLNCMVLINKGCMCLTPGLVIIIISTTTNRSGTTIYLFGFLSLSLSLFVWSINKNA